MLQKGGPGWMYPIPKDAELEPEDHPTASWRARKYLTRNRVFRRVCIILDLVAQASIAGAWALWIYDQTAGAGLADPALSHPWPPVHGLCHGGPFRLRKSYPHL